MSALSLALRAFAAIASAAVVEIEAEAATERFWGSVARPAICWALAATGMRSAGR